MDKRSRDLLVETCRAIAENPEDNDLIEGYIYELENIIGNIIWFNPDDQR